MLEEAKTKLNLSQDELSERITRLQNEYGGLLTDKGALEIILRENTSIAKNDGEKTFVKLADAMLQEQINARVIVKRVRWPRSFETNNRRGRVANITIADDSKTGVLVLWNDECRLVEEGKIRKNCVLELSKAFVKNLEPLELQSRLTSEITIAGIQQSLEEKTTALSELVEGNEVDVQAVVADAREPKEFITKDGRKGKLMRLVLRDDKNLVPVVVWGDAVTQCTSAVPGMRITIEGALVKNNAGMRELHVNDGIITLQTTNAGTALPPTKISTLAANAAATINATVENVFEARVSRKCRACKLKETECTCTKKDVQETLVVSSELSDESGKIRAVFFNETARAFLGIENAANIDAQTVVELKRNYLIGKKITLEVQAKQNDFTQKIEVVVKKIRAVE